MTKLTRHGVPWGWGPEQQCSFEDLKRALASKPVLVYPDFSKPFVVATDASRVGLGAVLMQDQDAGLQPVAYASATCSAAESKYGVSELECLAILWGLEQFRPYVYGRPITLITDHVALKWLMEKKDPGGRLHRWALRLSELDLKVIHRPGKENVVADALSRQPLAQATGMIDRCAQILQIQVVGAMTSQCMSWVDLDQSEGNDPGGCWRGRWANDCEVEHPKRTWESKNTILEVRDTVAANSVTPIQMTLPVVQAAQVASERVREWVNKGQHYDAESKTMVTVTRRHGIVKGRIQGVWKILLPPRLWSLALHEAHGSVWSGHAGYLHTLRRVRRKYWWPGLATTVRRWVDSCRDCGTRKVKPTAIVPPLRPIRVGEVNDRWALDLQGPFMRKTPRKKPRDITQINNTEKEDAVPKVDQDYEYVAFFTEYVTRFAVTVVLRTRTANEIARAFLDHVVFVFGPCRELMLDGAPEFKSSLFEQICTLIQVDLTRYIPTCYGWSRGTIQSDIQGYVINVCERRTQ